MVMKFLVFKLLYNIYFYRNSLILRLVVFVFQLLHRTIGNLQLELSKVSITFTIESSVYFYLVTIEKNSIKQLKNSPKSTLKNDLSSSFFNGIFAPLFSLI
uniref:Uncharacterized protein n=1 Tax=Heterorhabditis bacteriophora TaxID=37862 RepID=A0A1I7WWN0_HETBA